MGIRTKRHNIVLKRFNRIPAQKLSELKFSEPLSGKLMSKSIEIPGPGSYSPSFQHVSLSAS
jgi:hypothetical protein